ncbi:DUF2914 domain-containing protein [Thiogranum longum]|nr:DUF2914 domain-containing protein [Thiogranum longum]
MVISAQVGAEEALVAGGEVARASFTTRIANREPTDRVLVLNPPATEVYFFTDLRNLEGHTVTHRWEYQGRAVSNVPFVVGGNRWRVFSKKVFPPDSFGEWSVTVLDDNGLPLYVELFRYEPVDAGRANLQKDLSEGEDIPAQDMPSTAGDSSE